MNTDPDPDTSAPPASTSIDPPESSPAAPPFLPPSEPAAIAPDFRPLDPRVVRLWRLSSTISAAVLLLLASIGGAIVIGVVAGSWRFVTPGWLLLAGLRAWLWFWYPPRAYREWGYRVDGRVFEIRYGVWFKVIELLPLSRLQHVDLQRGPLERAFGLSSLVLHTAGTHNASIVVPGLAQADAQLLRDQLVAVGGDDAV